MAETPKAPLVNQPPGSALGTNKMNWLAVVALLTNVIMQAFDAAGWTEWLGDAEIVRQLVFAVVSLAVGWGAAWLGRDRGNQPQEVQALERAVINAGAPLPLKPEGNTP